MTRPGRLTSTAVVRAAVQLADERGIDAVTMRRLGAQVGVGAMALYHYVTGREALLDAMTADVLGELAEQLRPGAAPSTVGVRAYLEHTARATRSLVLAHTCLIRFVVTHPPLNLAVDAPLATTAALACTSSVLAALTHDPVDDAASIRTLRTFGAFLLGHLLLEIPPTTAGTDPRGRHQAPPLGPARRAQLLTRLLPLTETEPAAEFDRSLHTLLITLCAPFTRGHERAPEHGASPTTQLDTPNGVSPATTIRATENQATTGHPPVPHQEPDHG